MEKRIVLTQKQVEQIFDTPPVDVSKLPLPVKGDAKKALLTFRIQKRMDEVKDSILSKVSQEKVLASLESSK